jgi:predicted secreted protein
MNWFTAIMTYVIIWWTVLFAVLPWGNKPVENPEPGHAASAPAKPRLLIKFAVTSVISAVILAGVWWLIDSNLISLRQ